MLAALPCVLAPTSAGAQTVVQGNCNAVNNSSAVCINNYITKGASKAAVEELNRVIQELQLDVSSLKAALEQNGREIVEVVAQLRIERERAGILQNSQNDAQVTALQTLVKELLQLRQAQAASEAIEAARAARGRFSYAPDRSALAFGLSYLGSFGAFDSTDARPFQDGFSIDVELRLRFAPRNLVVIATNIGLTPYTTVHGVFLVPEDSPTIPIGESDVFAHAQQWGFTVGMAWEPNWALLSLRTGVEARWWGWDSEDLPPASGTALEIPLRLGLCARIVAGLGVNVQAGIAWVPDYVPMLYVLNSDEFSASTTEWSLGVRGQLTVGLNYALSL